MLKMRIEEGVVGRIADHGLRAQGNEKRRVADPGSLLS